MYELSMKKILFFLCGGDGSGFCLASIRFFGKKSLGKTEKESQGLKTVLV